ncbi:hypothetical protein IE53DRAFT_85172 [Violaceomyces palustris]|uniref:Uncharacterized protein n=1 Tax=Violaceomyces palustris TaxID=1673888 RepID=A0ACD0P781_9BASI|nr:hypothetical protein IE53DRAFT_85172 [Violaceomyces palustris]
MPPPISQQPIEIHDSSSPSPSPIHRSMSHDEEPAAISAASKVSLANLLGPSGPGASRFSGSSRSSPVKQVRKEDSYSTRSSLPKAASRRPPIDLDEEEEDGARAMEEDSDSHGQQRDAKRAGNRPRAAAAAEGDDASHEAEGEDRAQMEEDHREDDGDGDGDGEREGDGDDDEDDEDDDDSEEDGDDDDGEEGEGNPEKGKEEKKEGEGGISGNELTVSVQKKKTAAGEEGATDGGDGTDAGAGAAGAGAAGGTKVAKRRVRRRTPSPVALPKAPPTRPTVRLKLERAQDEYLLSIPDLVFKHLKEKKHPWAEWYETEGPGVVEKEPPPAPGDAPPGLEDIGPLARLLAKYPAENGRGDSKPNGGKRRRRRGRDDEYDIGQYDTKDPFVDDTELEVDEPTYFSKPKADGFYVTQGPVELAKLKPSRRQGAPVAPKDRPKPVSIRDAKSGFAGATNKLIAKRAAAAGSVKSISASVPSSSTGSNGSMQLKSLLNGGNALSSQAGDESSRMEVQTPTKKPRPEGTRDSPIKVDDDPTSGRPSSSTPSGQLANGKKNRYPTVPVDPRLAQAFEDLKVLVSKESFAVKTKFPPSLKPPLIQTAKLAVELGEYNDNFFNYLPTIFPYNRFTMMKLTKREFFEEHMNYFRELQDEHMEHFGQMIAESFPAQKAEYEKAHREWVERGGAEKSKGATDPIASEGIDKEAGDGGDPMDVDGQRPEGEEGEAAEPQKKWKWTEEMREEVFTCITVENAMSEIRNEKLKLENAPEAYSEINARKTLYKRMEKLWPEEGWTTSTSISREYAQLKKKKDRQEARGLEVDESRASSIVPL